MVSSDSSKNSHLHQRQKYNKGGPHCELEKRHLPLRVSENFTEVEACQAFPARQEELGSGRGFRCQVTEDRTHCRLSLSHVLSETL